MTRIILALKYISLLLALTFLCSCSDLTTYDLAIYDVKVFDSETKRVYENRTILINSDTITAIVDAGEQIKASKIINGNKRLVSPGFIDSHMHLTDIIGNYERAPEFLHKDSIQVYGSKLAKEYLAFGITTIKDAGHPEKWMEHTLDWQKNPKPYYPNIFISGAAIISDQEREPYIGHVEVQNPDAAAEKVQEYYDLGLKHIKLYWRLRLPEMKSAVAKAESLGMNMCAHIDFNLLSIQTVMSLGVKHFEHAYTPFVSAFNFQKYYKDFENEYKQNFENDSFWTRTLEIIGYLDSKPDLKEAYINLIDDMAKNEATLCTTIHLFGSIVNRTTHKTFMQTKTGYSEKFDQLTEKQLERLNRDFDALMTYFKIAHDHGVKLRIGTDCMNGGKAVLSEMLLLYEAGFSVEDILQIATLNGANAIDMGDKIGSLKEGKKADLVIFEKNPFEDYKNFLSEKIIIKDGIIYSN